jgi:E3 ubiquitin-protein ligase UBR4
MTKNPYSSVEIGPLMRDVKNKICQQLDMIGLIEDDYGMELLVSGNIISLDLSISQVYEQVWKKHHGQTQHSLSNTSTLSAASSVRDCPPMTVTYRLQVCVRVCLPFSCLNFLFTCRTLLTVAVSFVS